MNGSRKCEIHTHIYTHNGILFSLQNEDNPVIYNMDWAGRYYDNKISKP